jgi:hypothetical protein
MNKIKIKKKNRMGRFGEFLSVLRSGCADSPFLQKMKLCEKPLADTGTVNTQDALNDKCCSQH